MKIAHLFLTAALSAVLLAGCQPPAPTKHKS